MAYYNKAKRLDRNHQLVRQGKDVYVQNHENPIKCALALKRSSIGRLIAIDLTGHLRAFDLIAMIGQLYDVFVAKGLFTKVYWSVVFSFRWPVARTVILNCIDAHATHRASVDKYVLCMYILYRFMPSTYVLLITSLWIHCPVKQCIMRMCANFNFLPVVFFVKR